MLSIDYYIFKGSPFYVKWQAQSSRVTNQYWLYCAQYITNNAFIGNTYTKIPISVTSYCFGNTCNATNAKILALRSKSLQCKNNIEEIFDLHWKYKHAMEKYFLQMLSYYWKNVITPKLRRYFMEILPIYDMIQTIKILA